MMRRRLISLKLNQTKNLILRYIEKCINIKNCVQISYCKGYNRIDFSEVLVKKIELKFKTININF